MTYLKKKYKILIFVGFAGVVFCAFLKIHIKIQTIMIGYEIGKLKEEELILLKKRSYLTLSLAQLTTKDSLSALIKE